MSQTENAEPMKVATTTNEMVDPPTSGTRQCHWAIWASLMDRVVDAFAPKEGK